MSKSNETSARLNFYGLFAFGSMLLGFGVLLAWLVVGNVRSQLPSPTVEQREPSTHPPPAQPIEAPEEKEEPDVAPLAGLKVENRLFTGAVIDADGMAIEGAKAQWIPVGGRYVLVVDADLPIANLSARLEGTVVVRIAGYQPEVQGSSLGLPLASLISVYPKAPHRPATVVTQTAGSGHEIGSEVTILTGAGVDLVLTLELPNCSTWQKRIWLSPGEVREIDLVPERRCLFSVEVHLSSGRSGVPLARLMIGKSKDQLDGPYYAFLEEALRGLTDSPRAPRQMIEATLPAGRYWIEIHAEGLESHGQWVEINRERMPTLRVELR